MSYDTEEQGVDDMDGINERRLAQRVAAALRHPDCPLLILDHEASYLSRHIAIRLSRMPGKTQ